MRPVAHPSTPGWKAEGIETFRLAGPLALANILQMAIYSIDVIFIARLGADELAASSLAVSVFGLLILSLSGLTGAVAPIMAAELGARGPALRPVRRAVRMALWLSVGTGLVAMAMCAFAEQLMLAAGQQPRIAALAGEYSNLLLFSVIPMIAAGVLRNFVSTLGRPIFATAITALGIVVNGLCNYAFVFGNWGAPALGLQGAAIATIITTVAMLLAYVIAIRRDARLHRYHVFGFFWRPDWARLAEIVRIGTPIGLTIVAEAGIFATAPFLLGLLGADQLAAHAIALQIVATMFQVPFGVSQAATIRVGYFFGAQDKEGIRRAGAVSIVMGGGFMTMTALLLLFAPSYMLAIYIDPWNPENPRVVEYALSFLAVGAFFQLFDGLQVVAAGALRGLKDTRMPMWIAIFSYWVPGMGVAVLLGFYTPLEGFGVWLGLATGLVVAAALLTWRWHRREELGLTQAGVV
ncbi:MATE family efflux transporter [Aurantiacibacter rhizosphaerae]|uniref:Multidrug-efflux transporter n=1 Tax=Aurantiacibacter rhizosphaerae TaxID=2691582 RepID=A0A844XH35_9SPHN|nr:MATE family efflux transporter [Aurantiacibacter rhizosphaerae]MWV28835.1 MATE family efflux transporter [Aurantiacibacter rhizosphaerae]